MVAKTLDIKLLLSVKEDIFPQKIVYMECVTQMYSTHTYMFCGHKEPFIRGRKLKMEWQQ